MGEAARELGPRAAAGRGQQGIVVGRWVWLHSAGCRLGKGDERRGSFVQGGKA